LHRTLVTASRTWKDAFYDAGGLEAFAGILKKKGIPKVTMFAIKCIEAYVEELDDLKGVLGTPNLLSCIISCVSDKHFEPIRMRCLELLTVICYLTEEGRKNVMIELQQHQIAQYKVIPLLIKEIGALSKMNPSDILKKVKISTAIMVLFNGLIQATPDLTERVQMRRSLLDHGFARTIELVNDRLLDLELENVLQLQTQTDLFITEFHKDTKKASKEDLDISDPDACYAYLRDSTRDDGFSIHLYNIIHYLLTIPNSKQTAGNMWKNCEYIVQLACTEEPEDEGDGGGTVSMEELRLLLIEKDQDTKQESVDRLQQLEEETEIQKNDIFKLTVELEKLQQENINLKDEIKNIKNEELSNENRTLNEENKKLNEENKKSNEENKKLNEENKKLKKK